MIHVEIIFSNGLKKEIQPNPEHVDKKKDGIIKSPPKSSHLQNNKEIKSPHKPVCVVMCSKLFMICNRYHFLCLQLSYCI